MTGFFKNKKYLGNYNYTGKLPEITSVFSQRETGLTEKHLN